VIVRLDGIGNIASINVLVTVSHSQHAVVTCLDAHESLTSSSADIAAPRPLHGVSERVLNKEWPVGCNVVLT
jgi:hypothetical protein